MATPSSLRWGNFYRTGWQLTGRNFWSFLGFFALQIGALLLLTPTVSSFALQFDAGYAGMPMFDSQTSTIDVLMTLLALFLSLGGCRYLLSVVRGRPSLDQAYAWDGAALWSYVLLAALFCGAAVLWFLALALLFGAGMAGSLADIIQGSGPAMMVAVIWGCLGAAIGLTGAMTALFGWSFAPLFVADGCGAYESLKKSWQVTYGHRWQIFFLHVAPLLALSLIGAVPLVLAIASVFLHSALLTSALAVVTAAVYLFGAIFATGVSKFGVTALYVALSRR